MKSKKWLAVAGITMSAALLLAACGKTEKKAIEEFRESENFQGDITTKHSIFENFKKLFS